MGNALLLDAYWDVMVKTVKSRASEAMNDARITSPTSYQVYTIKEKIGVGQIYRAETSASSFILKIIECETYAALQALHRLLTDLQRHSDALHANTIVEFFHTRDEDGSWMMVVVLEFLLGVTLEEWIAFAKECEDVELRTCGVLERDVIIPAFKELLEILHRAEQLEVPIGAMTARRLFLHQQPPDAPRAFVRTENYSYTFVLLAAASDSLLSTKESHRHMLPPEADVLAKGTDSWGAGVIIYTVSAT